VIANARSYMISGASPGAGSARRALGWWKVNGPRHYSSILPGIRLLLSLPAGNAQLERFFGQAKYIMSQHRLSNQLGALFLWANAAHFGLEGYFSASSDRDASCDEFNLFHEDAEPDAAN
jgi:hypothetical protein